MAEPLVGALNRWTGRSTWTLKCEDVALKSTKEKSNLEAQSDACLFELEGQLLIMQLEVPDGLEKMATADALGILQDDITEALDGFSKIHGQVLGNSLIEKLVAATPNQNAFPRWISPDVAKIHCLKNQETWMCRSEWKVTDAAENREFTLIILLDRRAFPAVVDLSVEQDSGFDIQSLREKLGPCRLPVRIIGGNITLSIADCMKLEIGQTYGLPEIDFNAVDLKMPKSENILAQATLGTHCGAKAVRLQSEISDDFLLRYASELDPT